MTRTLQYSITADSTGLSVKEFLHQKSYSAQNLIQLKKRPESVLLNTAPARMNQRLKPGDSLEINIIEEYSSEKIPPVNLPLDIVYEDEDLLVVNKPAGMPIHPSMANYNNTVANALAWYFNEQNIPFVFRCINRLDRDTSGLTLIAKHYLSAGILSSMIQSKVHYLSPEEAFHSEHNEHPEIPGIRREYLAIAKGLVTPEFGTINAPLSRKPGSIIERMVDYEQGENAVTHYKVLKTQNNHSLVALVLETGRTHQIRIHMKHIGFPLIGDYLYHPDNEYINRQALHSYRLSFPHPITGQFMDFTAPLPSDMKKIIEF